MLTALGNSNDSHDTNMPPQNPAMPDRRRRGLAPSIQLGQPEHSEPHQFP
jgi:hypothetical protein